MASIGGFILWRYFKSHEARLFDEARLAVEKRKPSTASPPGITREGATLHNSSHIKSWLRQVDVWKFKKSCPASIRSALTGSVLQGTALLTAEVIMVYVRLGISFALSPALTDCRRLRVPALSCRSEPAHHVFDMALVRVLACLSNDTLTFWQSSGSLRLMCHA